MREGADRGRVDRLRHARQARATFEPRFYARHPAFWPIARAAETFADRTDWPIVADYGVAFLGEPPVRFLEVPPKHRRPNGQPIDRTTLYDATITLQGVVPTRARMWHDFLNALVWATFPRAKRALHRRQHRAIDRWIPEGATQLPNARTRELDALALVDEGGVLLVDDGETETPIVFGHALFEGLVFEQPAMVARAVELRAPAANGAPADLVATADALLAAILDDPGRIVAPEELPRRSV